MPRAEVMRHMLQENFALILPGRVEKAITLATCFCSKHMFNMERSL